jgi:hypothetical protein
MAASPVVRNRSAGDIQRQRALDHHHAAGGGNRTAGICIGQLLEKLTAQWASYIAFLASFCYAGVIWLNHRAVFARVRYCDRSLHLANLFLLLTIACPIAFFGWARYRAPKAKVTRSNRVGWASPAIPTAAPSNLSGHKADPMNRSRSNRIRQTFREPVRKFC